MITELVDTQDLINSLALLATNSNLIAWNKIPVLDTVLWFRGLDNGVSEGHPPFPMTVVREEVAEAFGVRASRPGLEDLVLPKHS